MEGPKGYDFEPTFTENEMIARRAAAAERRAEEAVGDNPAEPEPVPPPDRMDNVNWCNCQNCQIMATLLECRCCQEVDNCQDFLGHTVCIIDHEDFRKVCLEKAVLRTALVARLDCRGHRANLPRVLENRSYRYAAYRLFTYWVHGYLGRHVRKVIPSCVVTTIRQTFPDPNGFYVDFKVGDDGEELEVPEEFAI